MFLRRGGVHENVGEASTDCLHGLTVELFLNPSVFQFNILQEFEVFESRLQKTSLHGYI